MHYGNYFLLGQIMEAVNAPEVVMNYVYKEHEVKVYRHRYDIATGQFLSLYETVAYLIVRGDDEEHFFESWLMLGKL